MMNIIFKTAKVVCFFVVVSLVALGAWADTWTDPDTGYTWTYYIDEGAAKIADISPSPTGVIAIPSVINCTPVTSIGDSAFSGCSDLTNVTIPDSVTCIEDCAFDGCSGLTSVKIPDGVTSIGDETFYGCSSLTSVTIPNSVTSIGAWAFYECEELSKAVIYGNGLKRIGACAFQDCTSLDELIIPQSVVEIGDEAFCGIGVYHEGSIGKRFRYSDVIVIPRKFAGDCSYSSLDSFCLRVFGASYSDYYYYGSKYKWGGRIEVENIEIVFDDIAVLPDAHGNDLICRIEDGEANILKAMIDDSVVSYVIPSSSCGLRIVGMAGGVFSGCSGLTSVTIPDGVTSIGEEVFYDCSSLTSVTIPGSVTSIGHCAFEDCRALETLVVPSGVTNIGCRAFAGCDALRRVVLPKWCKTVNVYYDEDEYCILSMHPLSLDRGWARVGFVFHAFYGNDDSFEYPETVYRQIEEDILSRIQIAYADVGGDTPISEIIKEEGTADGCTWTYAVDGNAVKIIGVSPKGTLTGVVSVPATLGSLPVVGISAGVFRGCAGIEGVTIPDGVTEIGDGAFDGCGKLLTAWYRTLANISAAGSGIPGGGSLSAVTTVVQQVAAPYALTDDVTDRAIASVTVNSDCAIDTFVLKDGKVYDSMLYISNAADCDVRLSLPTGYVYKTFKGTKPLTIPAQSQCMISITRVADKTFLVSREDLEDVK